MGEIITANRANNINFNLVIDRRNTNCLKSWILGNVTRIPRHELPQTLDFSDFLPLFT